MPYLVLILADQNLPARARAATAEMRSRSFILMVADVGHSGGEFKYVPVNK